MKKFFILFLFSFFLISCGASRKTAKVESNTKSYSQKTNTKKSETERTETKKSDSKKTDSKVNAIISYAASFKGTKYKFGGTTKRGMDCSGLVYISFKNENISLPRISRDMAKKGEKISLNKAIKGDLVFFNTNKNNKFINHVGLVVEKKKGTLFFIHSTTTLGVIISSMDENYWNSAFVEARRVL